MRVAVVDVGSNTVRLLVADVDRAGTLEPVLTEKAYLGLGAEIARSGAISPERIAATARVGRRFAAAAAAHGAERSEVIVTAPGRQGTGAAELVAALRARTRLPVRILSGEDEGRLAYEGAVASANDELPGRVGVVDVGGGSTEIVVGRPLEGIVWAESVDLGSLRLTTRALPTDPPTKKELAAARGVVRDAFAPLRPPVPGIGLAVGGSARALARLVGRTLDDDELEATIATLARRGSAKVARAAGIDSRRAGTLLAGALLLQAASRTLATR